MNLMDRIGKLLAKRYSPAQEPPVWWNDMWSGGGNAGVDVTPERAMQSMTVFACVHILAETVAAMPLHVYRRLENGGKERATDAAIYPLLHLQPNPEMTSFELRETLMGHLGIRGNAYCEIQRNQGGQVIGLWPLRPDKMQVWRNAAGLVYHYAMPDKVGGYKDFTADTILHLRWFSHDGLVGMTPIGQAREAIGLALATEEFGSRYFGNGAQPGIVLEHPGRLSNTAQERMKANWNSEHQGLSNSHRIAILEEGMKIEKIGLVPEEAQFLECVVPGTMITMANGSRQPAESIQPGDVVMAWDGKPFAMPVKAVGNPPLKFLVRLTTVKGRTLTATEDHPCLARKQLRTPGGRVDKSPDKWVPIGELVPGNYVRVALGSLDDGEVRDFDTDWMLGALVGNGYIRIGECSFGSMDDGVISTMRRAIEAQGGELISSKSRQYDWLIKTNGSGRGGSKLRNIFRASCLEGSHSDTKRVPPEIMSGGRNAWIGFLSGYFDTDGTIKDIGTKSGLCASWSSVNRSLLEECQHLLALLGIQSGIYKAYDSGLRDVMGKKSEAKTCWNLCVMGTSQLGMLANALKLQHSQKSIRLAAYLNPKFSRYKQHNFDYDRVKSVEHLPAGETVGLEIAGLHTHITGGLVTHNTRKFQNLEIARLYRIPPHLLADLDRATFSNIEQMSLEFVAYTIQPWLSRWEQRMAVSLLSEAERRTLFIEFLLDNLVRGDISARYAAYAIGRQNGWLSADDIRVKENMNPLPDGEGKVYLIPMNMTPASSVGEPLPLTPPLKGRGEETPRENGMGRRDGAGAVASETLPVENEEQRAQWMNDRKRLTKTYRRVFAEVAGQIIRRETRDLRDGLKKSFGQRSYEGWTAYLDEYYRNIETYIKQKMGPVTETYAELVTQAMERELGIDVTDETTHNFALAYVTAYITRHVAKSRHKLDVAMAAAQKDGRDMGDAVNLELDEWEENRPDVIANEESVREGNAAAKAIYLLAGVEILRWYTAGAKPCPYCQEMNGKTVSITKYFKSAGDEYKPTEDSEPMKISHDMGHPPLHGGCECLIGRG